MKQESGRSMVEMLGVLAIIGVLSVGGVAGYKYAMNKYRANEILSETSMRSVIISAQIQCNHQVSPSLNEFTDNKVVGATIDPIVSYSLGSDFFSIKVSDIDSEVCAQIHNIIGSNGNVNIDEECSVFTYNLDLSPGVLPPATEGIECGIDKVCSGGASCIRGRCECATGVWVPTSATNTTAGSCVNPTEGDGNCSTNKDCNDGSEKGEYYCKYASVNASSGPSEKGICTSSKVKNTDYVELTTSADGIEGILSKSATGMNWWNAKNFCSSHGMHIPTLAESLVDRSALGTYFNNNGFCYDVIAKPDQAAQACEGGFAVSNYKGKLSGKYWWTSELRNSSPAFYVYLSLGSVRNSNRYNDYYALCVR